MKNTIRYDVFLSYRRDGGDMTALYLYERLTRAGYHVAYDFETLLNGRWDDKILETVQQCKDLVLVLNPGALDRCLDWENANKDSVGFDKNDWMRREVACALEYKKNVIPVLLRDFVFPPEEMLPKDIRTLPFQNGISASTEHHRDTLSRLQRMLTAKPVWYRRPIMWFTGIAAIIAIGLGFAVAFPKYFQAERLYPSTRAEIQQVNAVVSAALKLTTAYESAVEARLTLISKARKSIEVDNPSVYESAVSAFHHSMRETKDALDRAKPSESLLSSLRTSPIDTTVLEALYETADFELDDAALNLPLHLGFYVRKDNSMEKADKLDCIDRKKTDCDLHSRSFATGVIELFLPVSQEATADYRKFATTFVAIPRLSGEWTRDKETLEREQEFILRQLEASANETAALVGDMKRALADTTKDFKDMLVSMGASPEKATELSGKMSEVSSMKTELADIEARLAQTREEAYRKFRPLATDEPGILWGKILRFRKMKMQEAALECLDFLKRAKSPDFPPTVIRSMEMLVRLGDSAPVSNGAMVMGYEPPATSHAIFLIGDVISHRDGEPILRVDDYKTNVGSCYRFWRLDDFGVFRSHEESLPPDQPRIGLVNIAEKAD